MEAKSQKKERQELNKIYPYLTTFKIIIILNSVLK